MKRSTSHSDETAVFGCEHPDCMRPGAYRAPVWPPKEGEYIHLCLEHVRAYNAKWDALAGFSPAQIEHFIRQGTVWERPTWPFGKGPASLRKRAAPTQQTPTPEEPPAILAALAVLGLAPPVALASIKNRYRALVKKFHPDAAGEDAENTKRFLAIQEAFATLRAYYANVKKRPQT